MWGQGKDFFFFFCDVNHQDMFVKGNDPKREGQW